MDNLGGRFRLNLEWVFENPILAGLLALFILMTAGSAFASTYFVLTGDAEAAATFASIAAGFATILLVGVTAQYAISTRNLARANRIERRRPRVIALINGALNDMIRYLQEDVEKFAQVDAEVDRTSFLNLKNIYVDDESLSDLRTLDGTAMEKWADYVYVRGLYLEKRREVMDIMSPRVEKEFIGELDQHDYPDFIPDGFSEENLRNGMISSEFSETLERQSDNIADLILEDNPLDGFQHKGLVDEEAVVHQVYSRYRNELLEYREHDDVSKLLEEMEPLVADLHRMVDGVTSSIIDYKNELMNRFEILETSLETSEQVF